MHFSDVIKMTEIISSSVKYRGNATSLTLNEQRLLLVALDGALFSCFLEVLQVSTRQRQCGAELREKDCSGSPNAGAGS